MVRVLPSDLARLVLDYLDSEGLQDSYNVFLQESPHLQEFRNFSSTGILPLGAKNLEVIVEEYYELISKDNTNMRNVNDALYKLWKRFDAVSVQIKHHYKGSGAITTLSGETASQAVRSRYSLNRLHHERWQLERDQALQNSHFTAIRQPQQPPQQLHQRQQQVPPQMLPPSPFPSNQQPGERPFEMRSSTPRVAAPSIVAVPSPQENVTSTQPQYSTPNKTSQSDKQNPAEKVVGKSPKRKSAPPRRKPTSPPEDRLQNAPSTSRGTSFIDEIQDLPSPWGSVVNNMELVEKLAENINKILPGQENPSPEEATTKDPTDCIQPNPIEEAVQQAGGAGGHPLDDLLGGTMSDTMLDEFVDMTSSDPAFNSLFSLFNTDKERFLNSERKKLSVSSSEAEGELDSSQECMETASNHPDSTLPPSGNGSPEMQARTSQNPSVIVDKLTNRTGAHASENVPSTSVERSTTRVIEPPTSNPFPNMVVSRASLVGRQENCSTTSSGSVTTGASQNPGVARTVVVNASKRQPSKQRKMIVRSLDDRTHIRTLSFGHDASPMRGEGNAITQKPKPTQKSRGGTVSHENELRAALTRNNNVTPIKRQIKQSPARVYSPKEKVVAQLLTKLPTTPSKMHVVEAPSPRGKRIFVVTQTVEVPEPAKTNNGTRHDSIDRKGQASTSNVHLNGVKLADLPGHTVNPARAGGSDSTRGGATSEKGDGSSKTAPQDAAEETRSKPSKKGVKRERKAGDKSKGAKKSKQSKSKSLGFPVNLDVDKFLAGIHDS